MKKNEIRRENVLAKLVDDYIETCEPVSSKKICEKYMNNISPATIRIDLNKLEKENYIYQQHISSGRIPTIKGYRKYLELIKDEYIFLNNETVDILRDILIKNYDDVNMSLQYIMQLLAKETYQLSFVAEPEISYGYLRKIDVFRIGKSKLLFVVSLDSGLDKTVILNPDYDISEQQLKVIVRYVNEEFAGLRIFDIQNKFLEELYQKQKSENKLIVYFLNELRKALIEISSYYIHFDGSINFLEQPEFNDNRSILTFLNFIQRQDRIIDLMKNNSTDTEPNVIMGEELGRADLAEYSMVYAKYSVFGVPGYLGIVGPLRMNYKKNIPLVKEFTEIITKTTEKGVVVRNYGKGKN